MFFLTEKRLKYRFYIPVSPFQREENDIFYMQGDELSLKAVEWMFNQTAIKVGTGDKSKRCVKFYNDLTESEEAAITKTRADEDAVLFVFRRKSLFYSAYVAGDTKLIYTETDNLAHALFIYAAVFKVFRLEVPKMYGQFIGLLNGLILKEKWDKKFGRQTTGSVEAKKQLEKEIERGVLCSGIGKQN